MNGGCVEYLVDGENGWKGGKECGKNGTGRNE